MTHADLCKRAGAWLRGRHKCCVVAVEPRTMKTGEQPDAIGWTSYGWSVLVEVKVSRSDFLRDRHKPHRQTGTGMGQERWYLAPPGVLRAEDMPDGWGLAEAHERMVRVVKPAASTGVMDHARFRWEVGLLLSLVQRERMARGVDLAVGSDDLPDLEPEAP